MTFFSSERLVTRPLEAGTIWLQHKISKCVVAVKDFFVFRFVHQGSW